MVTIRALAEEHIPHVIAACADWEELAQYGAPYWRPRSTAELRRKISATAGPQPATEYSFILVATDGALVGECSLHAIDWRSRVAQVGVCIWRPSDRKQGYGQAAVENMISWGIGHLGLVRLEAWIVAGNEPSRELFARAGFVHEGTLRQRYLHAGVRRDMHVMGLLAPA
jgi:ribosomal-protein-alanine N-acetyltransferase